MWVMYHKSDGSRGLVKCSRFEVTSSPDTINKWRILGWEPGEQYGTELAIFDSLEKANKELEILCRAIIAGQSVFFFPRN